MWAIQHLTSVIEKSTATTLMGLEKELMEAADTLKRGNPTSISLAAGCELFIRYVTRTHALEFADLTQAKKFLIERGHRFAETSLKARAKVAEYGDGFVRDGSVILTHGLSRVVVAVLKQAAAQGKHFSVVVTEGRPDNAGLSTAKLLAEVGIPVTVVLDSAAAFMMERVDMVLVGAEAVVESGGIINKLGTFQIATVAKAFGKPLYVAAESYKFARLFPLTQRDLPVETKPIDFGPLPDRVSVESPTRDYTPPAWITLLFTDLGVLTPSAVSDELIQLYL